MSVGFLVDCFFYEIGRGDFLHSFFSTISYHLEQEGWGTKYPYLMNDLYYSKLKWTDASKTMQEAREIEEKLKNLPPEAVIWDIDDPSKQPPWGNNISEEVTSLANYFATSNRETFFEILNTALKTCQEEKFDLVIKKL
ncbi:immunity 70 family protein [Aneurinibacillus sp. BA2021]|nr:immunity 70 family protein [Aneurinibacillus sp. BA2021]